MSQQQQQTSRQASVAPAATMDHETSGGEAPAGAGAQLAPVGGSAYVVQRGDTLWSIAQRAYGSGARWTAIRDANPGRVFNNGDLIYVNTQLTIPTVQTGSEAPSTGPETPDTVACNPADEPRSVVTDYGTFEVYPDCVEVCLAPAARTDASWAILQADFAALQHIMEGISGGLSGITVNGSDTFKTAVMMDFGWLMTQGAGRELLSAMIASGRSLTINETSGGNTTGYTPNADSFERADGTPGPGADITVGYNPVEWNPYGGAEAWQTRPPAIGLAHELVHGWTGMYGTRALGQTDGVNRRELQATGLGEFVDAAFTENKFRAAFGLPLRPEY